jgi:hypothetical protein
MGVRAAVLAITPLTAETAAAATAGQDLAGMLVIAAQHAADATAAIKAIQDFMPAGTNFNTLTTQLTALS